MEVESSNFSLDDLKQQWHDEVVVPSTGGNKVVDTRVLKAQAGHFIDRWQAQKGGDHIAGFFYLRDWMGNESEKLKGRRAKLATYVFNTLKGDIAKDRTPKGDQDDDVYNPTVDEKFESRLNQSYAAAYLNRENGASIFESIRKTARHVFKYQRYALRMDPNSALNETFNLMFGDTVYERNGGENTPNGLGLWHSKDMLNKYNLTLGDLEEYKINTWFQLTKGEVRGKPAKLFLGRDVDTSLPLHEVARGIVKGGESGASVWWTIVNDTETGNYRVVMARKSPASADLDIAAKNMATAYSVTPGIEIVGNAYYDDGEGKKAIVLTPDEYMRGIAEYIAYDHLNQHMDFWDTNFGIEYFDKKPHPATAGAPNPIGAMASLKVWAEDKGLLTPGPDVSRRRVKHYYDKFGPDSAHYNNPDKARAWTLWAFGSPSYDDSRTGWGTDLSDPGKLEMDLVWIPIWKSIQELETLVGRNATRDEIHNIYKMRRQEMFKGPTDPGLERAFNAYDLMLTVPVKTGETPAPVIYRN